MYQIQLGMDFIQEWRIVQAMAETSVKFAITDKKQNELEYLKRFHPVNLGCGSGLPVPEGLIGIDHNKPVCRIGNIYRTLIYPHYIFDYCRKLWQDYRPIRFGFVGLAHTTRDMTLRSWYDRCGAGMPSILPENWGNEADSNRDLSFRQDLSGTCAIIYSDKGRNFPVKVWDDDYYHSLAKTGFALCPDGEKVWSYRFFEAIMCGAIPVIQTRCSAYDGFKFYMLDDACGTLEYRKSEAEYNFNQCRTKLTVPLELLNATLMTCTSRVGWRPQHPEAPDSGGRREPDRGMGATDAEIASEQDVVMAYRLILGREPENPAAIQNIVGKTISFTDMRKIFLRSAEFRDNVMGNIGGMLKPLDWDANSVETEVDDGTLGSLYAHIEQVWSNLGSTEPHYSILTDQKFKSANFRQHAEEFYASGSRSLRPFTQTLQRNSINAREFRDCFELGCGVGRITFKLAEIFPRVIAADVSAPHIALARSALPSSAQKVVEFWKLESIKTFDLLPDFDVFFSVIVLQHNPPPLIGVVLRKILSKLRVGGIAYFQVPTYALGYHFDSKTYLRERIGITTMEMHVFPQRELFGLIKGQGCRVVEVREDNCVGNRNMISNTILVMK